ncbi:MAG: UDP-3-O-(3-hydroxymyristoyl)glucosamine N-acyltransferase [Synergistaceae bacterium]|jgi:UDP-3-O-[3-hydroxymyristoyl] glucosamine N-acyltransferase|nr:UDP-3-O-(3-hydroxymyristoyl)glucosamine N-acyltransferase [Synergistaceae bacterium]
MPAVTLREVARVSGGTVVGDGDRVINGVCSPAECREGMLCVVWDHGILELIPHNIPVLTKSGTLSGRDGIEHESPREALVDLLTLFDRRAARTPGVHPSASLAEGCSIGEGVYIGPCCVLTEGANIGDRTVLQGNVFVGRDVVIGSDSRIEACVALHDFVEIGSRVIIHSGVTVGCDGFGHVQTDGGWRKIPQIGIVIIEDDVEIGPNSTIDRATFGVTRVRRGTKLGSLLHVAHNCDIGNDSVMAGCTGIGGSVTIGRGVIAGGMVGIADHVTIGNGVTIAGRSGVTKNVRDGLTVSGFPAQEHMVETRFQASLRHVRDHTERIRKIEKILEKSGLGDKRNDEL